MIYMVEMALLDMPRRAEWEAWYTAHQHRLLAIPGIHASQRFECTHAVPAPFVAIHEVDGPEVFTSDTYRAHAGPSNTGEWQAKMTNWHRNLFRGIDHTPDVAPDQRLVVIERNSESALPRDADLRWMEAVGLDQTVRRRGLAVMAPAQADLLAGTPGIRVLKPLGPRLVR
ncbi:MAG: hypothetical protein WDN25_19500 [Acetobacteraceae bacterium]